MKLSYSLGISTKIILVVTTIIGLAIWAVVFIASDLYQEESTNRIQVTNKDSVLHSSQKVQKSLEDTIQQMKLMAKVLEDNGTKSEQAKATIYRILSGFDHFISFHMYRKKTDGSYEIVFSSILETALSEFSLSERQVTELPEFQVLAEAAKSNLSIVNSAKHLKRPILSLVVRSDNQDVKGEQWLFRSEIRQSLLLQALPESNEIVSYILKSDGELLSHTDPLQRHQIIDGLNFAKKTFVSAMLGEASGNRLLEYTENGSVYLAAYRKVPIAGLYIVAQVPKASALATIRQVQYRSLLIMLIVISLAFIINYLFSLSLTQPLKSLYLATEKIVEGDYDIRLKKSSTDEVGALTLAFNDMAAGLKEKEKIKHAFNKFHSKEVAKKLLSGEIKIGGERRVVSILFSDIRGFTSMSETMSPDEVVLLLNEYLSAMVSIIYKWNGIVDKFIGDAIMAVWGAPEKGENDSYNAVMAALEMRAFMRDWEKKRLASGKTAFSIGIGIHTGEVLAGNIGSEERLEYTCIGDSVNHSSRVEAATKAAQTDILISNTTAVLVAEQGIVLGPIIEVSAKGKSENLKVQKVIGYKDESGEMHTCLEEEEIQKINAAVNLNLEASEEKTAMVSPPSQSVEEKQYLIDYDQKVEGPFSIEQVKAKMSQNNFNPEEALIMREGEAEKTNLLRVEELNRRQTAKTGINVPPPPDEVKSTAFTNEWYLAGPKGEAVGPYSFQELEDYVKAGKIQRTTYVWKSGMEHWCYLHEIPGFDRRSAS